MAGPPEDFPVDDGSELFADLSSPDERVIVPDLTDTRLALPDGDEEPDLSFPGSDPARGPFAVDDQRSGIRLIPTPPDPPSPPPPPLPASGTAANAAVAAEQRLRAELRAALASLGQQLHAGLMRLTQRLGEETGDVRAELHAQATRLVDLQTEDRAGRAAQLKAIGDGHDRLRAEVAQVLGSLRGEVRAALAAEHEARDQATEARWAAHHAAAATRDERLRVELTRLQKELQAGVKAAVAAALERQAQQRDARQAELQAALAGAGEDARALSEVVTNQAAALAGRLEADLVARVDALRREIAGQMSADREALRSMLAEDRAGIRAEVENGLAATRRLEAQSWESRRAELEAALADFSDQVSAVLAGERRDLEAVHLRLADQAIDEQRWGALESTVDEVRLWMAQVSDLTATLADRQAAQLGRIEDIQGALAAAAADQRIERRDERAEFRAELEAVRAALGDLAAERAPAADGSGVALVRLRDELTRLRDGLGERLDEVVASTAEASTAASAAVRAARDRRQEQAAQAELGEQLDALRADMAKLQRAVSALAAAPVKAPAARTVRGR